MIKNTQIYWLTGLSGAGKSTIAIKAKDLLERDGLKVRIVDGDDIRERQHKHLDFSCASISENNRLIAELCCKFKGEYDCILITVIAPFDADRKNSRRIISDNIKFVYVKASIDEVIKRDVKGLYKKALAGEIKNFIGIDKEVPYQEPLDAELVINTDQMTVEDAVELLIKFIYQNQSSYSN